MAKNNKKQIVKTNDTDETLGEQQVQEEVAEMQEVSAKAEKKQKPAKEEKQQKKNKAVKNAEPKKSRIKEIFGELKKVSWPSFGKTMKQTGMVLSIVLIFGVVVFGFDVLISYLFKLLTSL